MVEVPIRVAVAGTPGGGRPCSVSAVPSRRPATPKEPGPALVSAPAFAPDATAPDAEAGGAPLEVAVHENDECSARALHLLHQVRLAVLHAEAGDQVAGDAGTGRQAHRPCVEHRGALTRRGTRGVGGRVAAPRGNVLVGLLAH